MDFRKKQRKRTPIHIDGTAVEKVKSFKFLRVYTSLRVHITQCTPPCQVLGLALKALTNFYRCTIESILSACITTLYGNCTARNRRPLQRLLRSAQRITGGTLPALQDTYSTRCHRKAKKIIKENNHPSQCLFTPLSSRRRGQYRCIKAGTERLKKQLLSQGH